MKKENKQGETKHQNLNDTISKLRNKTIKQIMIKKDRMDAPKFKG
jgi:hypothetical protein